MVTRRRFMVSAAAAALFLLLPLPARALIDPDSVADQVVRLWFHHNDAYEVIWILNRLSHDELVAVWNAVERKDFVRRARYGGQGRWYARLYVGLRQEFMERIRFNR